MKIIGNGLIARSLANIRFSEDCVIIASGVSNSLEQKISEFERETNLTQETIQKNPDSKIIYFSTTSVLQPEQTPYVKHKLAMEGLIAAKSNFFHIFRVPQLVGVVKNSTLISFFVASIVQGKELAVQNFAERNLVDVADLARFISFFVENNIAQNRIMTVAAGHNVKVLDIVNEISAILNKDALIKVVDSGYKINPDIGLLRRYIDSNDPVLASDYWKKVLRKYVPLILEQERSASLHDYDKEA